MKTVKNFTLILLVLCMVLGLCACGGAADSQQQTTQGTEATTEATTEAATEATVPEGMAVYTVTVTDEGGNPVAGAAVQICKEDCFPGITDANGVATFTRPATEGYKISFMGELPAGYEYSDEQTEFYFDGSATEITIVLKSVA